MMMCARPLDNFDHWVVWDQQQHLWLYIYTYIHICRTISPSINWIYAETIAQEVGGKKDVQIDPTVDLRAEHSFQSWTSYHDRVVDRWRRANGSQCPWDRSMLGRVYSAIWAKHDWAEKGLSIRIEEKTMGRFFLACFELKLGMEGFVARLQLRFRVWNRSRLRMYAHELSLSIVNNLIFMIKYQTDGAGLKKVRRKAVLCGSLGLFRCKVEGQQFKHTKGECTRETSDRTVHTQSLASDFWSTKARWRAWL